MEATNDIEKHSVIDEQVTKLKLEHAKKINPIKTLNNHLFGVSCLSYKKDNKSLLSGSFDNTINSYDINTLEMTRKYEGHKEGVWTLSQNRFNNVFASAGTDTDVYLWDSNSKSKISELKFHTQTVYGLKFSDHNKDSLLSCEKGQIALWDLKNTSKPIKTISNKDNKFVYATNFIQNDKYIVYGLIDGGLTVVRLDDLKEISTCNFSFSGYKSEVNIDPDNSVSSNMII